MSNLAAFSLENLVEDAITFMVWLFKFALFLQEEIAGVDEQYKKLNPLTDLQTCPILHSLESTGWHFMPHVNRSQKHCYIDKPSRRAQPCSSKAYSQLRAKGD